MGVVGRALGGGRNVADGGRAGGAEDRAGDGRSTARVVHGDIDVTDGGALEEDRESQTDTEDAGGARAGHGHGDVADVALEVTIGVRDEGGPHGGIAHDAAAGRAGDGDEVDVAGGGEVRVDNAGARAGIGHGDGDAVDVAADRFPSGVGDARAAGRAVVGDSDGADAAVGRGEAGVVDRVASLAAGQIDGERSDGLAAEVGVFDAVGASAGGGDIDGHAAERCFKPGASSDGGAGDSRAVDGEVAVGEEEVASVDAESAVGGSSDGEVALRGEGVNVAEAIAAELPVGRAGDRRDTTERCVDRGIGDAVAEAGVTA